MLLPKSAKEIDNPEFRKANSRRRFAKISILNFLFLKVVGLGKNFIFVPLLSVSETGSIGPFGAPSL